MDHAPIFIALAGLKFAGKGTLAKYATEHYGYTVFRTRDVIMHDAPNYGVHTPPAQMTVPEMIEVGNAGRKSGGNGYWATRQTEIAAEQGVQLFVMDGVRHPDELVALIHAAEAADGVFAAVGIEAPLALRFARTQARNDEGDKQLRTIEAFMDIDDRDRGIGQPWHGQQVDATLSAIRLLDHLCREGEGPESQLGAVLTNSGTLKDFQNECGEVLNLLQVTAEAKTLL